MSKELGAGGRFDIFLDSVYIFRGSKVIDIGCYPSFLVMSITFDLCNI